MARSRSVVRSVSAPTGGLNVVDQIQAMPRGDALVLKNWLPQQYGVKCRKGWSEWAINLGTQVNTILPYHPDREDLASYRLFGITDSAIYNVTSSTDTPVSVFTLSGADSAGRFTGTMFTNTAGAFLAACSHTGGYFTYDGSTWLQRVAGAAAGEINGVDPDDLVFVASWKRRLWFVEKDSTNAWYLATDAIAGTITKLELGPFVKRGGKLSFITNWTIDAGEGIDDLIVFAFEGGDVLIYKGTDPGSSSTFALVGSWFAGGLPAGRRCFSQFGGDILILTETGLIPISYVTRGGQSFLRAGETEFIRKVQPAIAQQVSSSPLSLGWDVTLSPKDDLLMVHLPPGVTGRNQQYALSTTVNGWCLFEDIPMRCAAVANNFLWFGTEDGRVCKALDGYFDAVAYGETTGNGISGTIQPAYSYFGLPGMYKHFQMVRPTFIATDLPGVSADVACDYAPREPSVSTIATDVIPAQWDTAIWDAATWDGAQNVYQNWLGAEGWGYVGAAYIKTYCVGETLLASIDYMMEPGGPL